MVSYDWTNGRSSCCHSPGREVFIVFHCQVVSTNFTVLYLNYKFWICAGKRESSEKLKWKQQRFDTSLLSVLLMERLYYVDDFSPWYLFMALSGRLLSYHFQYKCHGLCLFLFLYFVAMESVLFIKTILYLSFDL